MRALGILGPGGNVVDPEPVVVRVGDLLQWQLTTLLPNRHILWTMYFSGDGPLGPAVTQVSV
jgi:hypothetical protein